MAGSPMAPLHLTTSSAYQSRDLQEWWSRLCCQFYRLYLGLNRARSGPGACLTLFLINRPKRVPTAPSGRRAYNTPFRGGGARLCNQTRCLSSMDEERRSPPPPGSNRRGLRLASARYRLPSSLAREVLRERAHRYSAAPRRGALGLHAGPPRSPRRGI